MPEQWFQAVINSSLFVDHSHLYKTEVKNIDQERQCETIKYINSSSMITDTPETLPGGNDYMHPYPYATERSSKGKEYIQPYSHIQQPYLDISDITAVSVRQHIGKVKYSFYFWDTSTSSQVSNCDGVVFEIYLDH